MKTLKDLWNNLKIKAKELKQQIYILYLSLKHPNSPWYAKAFTMLVVCYAFSPIDVIPDFIPILGYLDELVILPIGVTIAIKLLPKEVIEHCRESANNHILGKKPTSWIGGAVIVFIWIILFAILFKSLL